MACFSSSARTRTGFLGSFASACGVACLAVGSLQAEGVISGNSFVSGGLSGDVSLVSDLGDAALSAELPRSREISTPSVRVQARSSSPQERVDSEVGNDLFRNLRLALPLFAESAVGAAVDAPMIAAIKPMSGPMVGVRPNPRVWGSTFGQ